MSGANRKIRNSLVAAILAAAGVSQAYAASNPVRYTCSATADLVVVRNGSTAHVDFAGRSYDLQRKHSSIGDKYLSDTAALILDGDSAVFVTPDDVNLGPCVKSVPVASVRRRHLLRSTS